MGKTRRVGLSILILFLLVFQSAAIQAQCTSADIMEPGFKFLTSSTGCAPFTVQIQTEYFGSTVGTNYFVDWGDGTPEEVYTQTSSSGVIIQHTYPNSPVNCGYDIIIDAENTCNPRGSVTPVETQVIVWTNDVISINPQTFRVCRGFAQELQFVDDSDWNCFPYPNIKRENNVSRWIQWIYGTGDPAIRISGITVDGVEGAYPYNNPDPAFNPYYPATTPGQITLPIQIPSTTAADIGKEFEVTLKNWNQCNPYDNNIEDSDPTNPVNGDMVNGDNAPMTTTAKIVIVDAPEPDFVTRAGNSSGPLQTTFCIDEEIYFENMTPTASGAVLEFSWEFYDNESGSGSPIQASTEKHPTFQFSNPGVKLIRLRVRDTNAAGTCEVLVEKKITVSPLLKALIGVSDTNDNPITPQFCQLQDESVIFTVRFSDESYGTVTSDIRWKWEFYDENNTLVRSEPSSGYSSTSIGPFDIQYQREGDYLVKLIVLDNITGCSSEDTAYVRIDINPTADFSATTVCFGDSVSFKDLSTSGSGQAINLWEYDFYNDGSVDTTFNSSTEWNRLFSSQSDFDVKLKVYTDIGCADSAVQTVIVKPIPEAKIAADRTSGCSELEITFQNLSWSQAVPVSYYQWEIDSGTGFKADSVQDPDNTNLNGTYTRTFINNGSADIIYNVRLLAQGENGCNQYSNTLAITVTPGASSGFTSTNYSPYDNNCSPQEINFEVDNETQALNPSSYNWDILIGDSIIYSENTGIQPSFTYSFTNETNSAQDFNIRLTTSLNSDCSSDSTISVKINPAPGADFTIDTVSFDCEQIKLKFNSVQKGLSSYNWRLEAAGVIIFSYEGVQDHFEYLFDRGNDPEDYVAYLTTKNLANCNSVENSEAFTVAAINNFTASFTVSPNNPVLPDGTVTITDQSTNGDWEYLWEFGNGDSSTDPQLTSYTYTNVGDYIIKLTISDGLCSKSYVQTISVTSPPPTVDFTYDPAIGCLPLKVDFTNLSINANSYFWEFGDGGTSTAEHPEYTYLNAGLYTVKLTVIGKNGEEVYEIKSDIIEVIEKPFAFFEVRPNLIYIPDNPLQVRNLSEGADTYLWDFGDGSVSDEFQPQHTYTAPGIYSITLRAYNDYCYDSLTLQGVVEAKYSGRVLIPNAFSPNRSGPGSIGSGENDIFLPLLAEVADYQLQIFNRWGELIFEGKNQGWDGYFNGQLCPQDVYIYKLEVKFTNGDRTTKVGDINLIR